MSVAVGTVIPSTPEDVVKKALAHNDEWLRKEKELSAVYNQCQLEIESLRQKSDAVNSVIFKLDQQLREVIAKIDANSEEKTTKSDEHQRLLNEKEAVMRRHSDLERKHGEVLHRIVSERTFRADLHARKIECEQQIEVLSIELKALQSSNMQVLFPPLPASAF